MPTAETLAVHPIFAAVDRDAAARELGRTPALIRRFEPGRVIFSQGDPFDEFTVLRAGTVSATIDSPSGQSLLVETLVAPEILAPAMVFARDSAYPVTITAATPVELVSVSLDAFRRLGNRFPGLYEELLRVVSEKFQFITTKMRLLHFSTLRQKIAGYILNCAAGRTKDVVELPYTRDKLAELFGVARPSLSRAIGELVSEGVLEVSGRKVIIRRIESLKLIAAGE